MANQEFITFLLDQLGNPPDFHFRKMFGVHCLLANDKIIAIITKDYHIFVKANADTLPVFQAENATQFRYTTSKGVQTMHFWSIPESAIEESEELKKWVNLGIQAAGSAR